MLLLRFHISLDRMEKTIKNSLFKIVVTNLKFEQRFEQFESKHQIFLSGYTMEMKLDYAKIYKND